MPGGKRGQSCTLSPITPSTSPSEYKKRPTAAESRRNNHGENLRKLPQIGNVQAQRQRLPQLAAEKKGNPEGHAGETREQRILEYITANPRRYVVGLREGCMLHYENGKLELIGSRPMRIFKKGIAPYEVKAGDDLSFLL